MRKIFLLGLVAAGLNLFTMPAHAAAPNGPANLGATAAGFGAIKPPSINQLVAARLVALTTGSAVQLRNGRLQKFISHLTGPAEVATVGYKGEWDFGIQPVAFEPAAVSPMVTQEVAAARLRFLTEPQLSMTESGIRLDSGVAIVEALRDVVIQLREGRVELHRGAVVKVSALARSYRIINIVDAAHDSTLFHVCKRNLTLAPGQEVVYSVDKDSLSENARDGCGRRNPSDHSCCTYAIRVNEVSVAALLKNDAIGRQIYRSKDAQDRNLAARIVKVAAALALWSKANTPYSWN